MPAEKITIFLQTGEPQRIRTAEISGWVGKGIAGPKTDIELLFARPEAEKPGVYFLIGQDPFTGKWTAYIGEAENLKKRLLYHRAEESWLQFVTFVTKDDALTKAHIRYLEGRLIEEARTVDRFQIRNDNHSGAKLPEADREDMESYLRRIRQLLPLLGCDVLSPLVQSAQKRLRGNRKGLTALGQRNEKGFVVFAGSQAVPDLVASAPAYIKQQRDELISEGKLAVKKDILVFEKNIEFSSPSMAGSIICGAQVNGMDWWRDEEGRSLNKIEGLV